MIVNYVKGDLVTMIRNTLSGNKPKFIMAQGCNCQSVQGGGLAGQLREFPEIYQADLDYPASPVDRLGNFSHALLEGINSVVVMNAYTQYDFGTDKRHADYSAIRQIFKDLNTVLSVYYGQTDLPIYIPRIGAGLAGGDWKIIEKTINDVTPDIQITVVDYKKHIDPR